MGGIFLSYRREDSAGWTGRLSEDLKERFGPDSIFMDIDTIEPGTDFTEALHKAVSACDVLLAIIGPDWATATDLSGKPRLNDPNDWVRVEITAALKRKIRVIPVLVGGAAVPTQDLLPDELDALALRQALELTDKRWNYDVEQLVRALPPSPLKRSPRSNEANVPTTSSPAKSIIIGCLVIALAIVLWNNLPSGKTPAPPESRNAQQPSPPISEELPAQPQTSQSKPHETPTAAKPSLAPSPPTTSPPPGSRVWKAINLLAAEHGGHLLVSSADVWANTIDGKENIFVIGYGLTEQSTAVYAFKDEQAATIDRFTMLIAGTTGGNVKEFELLAGTDSPTGAFHSLGTFQTQNVKLLKTPYQEFTFPPVKAKYLKIKLLSTYDGSSPRMSEVQLFGHLDAR